MIRVPLCVPQSLPLNLPSSKVLRDITVPFTPEKVDEVTPRRLVYLIRPFARHGDNMTHKTTDMSRVSLAGSFVQGGFDVVRARG